MFETLQPAPPDPILGLTEAYNRDKNPQKVNLGVGVFKDAHGRTPTLDSVRTAQKLLLEDNPPMTYLPITGSPSYAQGVGELLFGAGSEAVREGRVRIAHTPGGTGALRVAADFIRQHKPQARIWMSQPTWANHGAIFAAAGVETASYPYYDPASQGLDFQAMTAALAQVPRGDVVLLHACCHNPSGIDPSAEQWRTLAELQQQQGFLPLFDFAYQGFAQGLREDALAVEAFLGARELLLASSFSKNFGLYNQRTGALTVVGASSAEADLAFGHVKRAIRANYSNPPAYGGALVTTVLGNADLRAQWEGEVSGMRERIFAMRLALVGGLRAAGVDRDFGFLLRQRGMFSFSGLSDAHVAVLRERYSIYIVRGGRINVAGVTPENVDYLCKSIASVVASP